MRGGDACIALVAHSDPYLPVKYLFEEESYDRVAILSKILVHLSNRAYTHPKL